MGRALKWLLIGLGLILIVGAVLAALNWSTIQRLKKVQTMFEPESIVHNFSHMDEVLFSRTLEATAPPHVWPETPESLPETVSIGDQDRNLSDFLTETATTSFLVIRDGKILSEDYFLGTGQDDLRISWSMAKSFLSALMGQAVESEQIKSLDDKVETYAPSLKGSAYEGVSIRQVLQMASGVNFNEDYLDPKSDINKMGRVLGLGGSMDEFTATLKNRQYEPGSARQYVSIDTHVAGMVLRAATGKSLHELFNESFGQKLGFGKAPYYLTDGEGVAFALGGMNMRTRDYALFGQLIMQGGEWKGEQIIPANWVAKSTAPSAPEKDLDETGFGYGYQWWVQKPYEGDYHARGIYSQYIFIDPETKMVIVKTSAQRDFLDKGKSGKTYKLETIDMFRSLAAHYVQKPAQAQIGETANLENITYADIESDDSLFGCGCTFNKDGQWLFSALLDGDGYFKRDGTIKRLKPIPESGTFSYVTYSYQDDKTIVSFDFGKGFGAKTGMETEVFDGALTVNENNQMKVLKGKVSCGC